jgi:hypothetical protein
MGWRYRRSFRIAPGVRLNMGKSGFTSLSVGGRGATLNLGKRGVTSTVSLPGTGLSYQHRFKSPPPAQQTQSLLLATPASSRTISIRACVVGTVVVVGGYLALRSPTPSSSPSIPVASLTAPVVPAVVTTASAAPVGPQTAAIVPQTGMARDPAVSIPTRQVTTVQANVRAAPSMSGPVVRTFLKGQMVQVLQIENGWTRIAEQDGEPIGWMHNSVLK